MRQIAEGIAIALHALSLALEQGVHVGRKAAQLSWLDGTQRCPLPTLHLADLHLDLSKRAERPAQQHCQRTEQQYKQSEKPAKHLAAEPRQLRLVRREAGRNAEEEFPIRARSDLPVDRRGQYHAAQ